MRHYDTPLHACNFDIVSWKEDWDHVWSDSNFGVGIVRHWSNHEPAAGCTYWIRQATNAKTYLMELHSKMSNEFVHRQLVEGSPILWRYQLCFDSTLTPICGSSLNTHFLTSPPQRGWGWRCYFWWVSFFLFLPFMPAIWRSNLSAAAEKVPEDHGCCGQRFLQHSRTPTNPATAFLRHQRL